jgi:hypothetical protein
LEKVIWRLFLSSLRLISMRCFPVRGVPRGRTMVAIDPKQKRRKLAVAVAAAAALFLFLVPQRGAL